MCDWIDGAFALNEGGFRLLEGGKKIANAVQSAQVVVNSRMMPGSDPQEVLGSLIEAVANPEIEIVFQGGGRPSEPSPFD